MTASVAPSGSCVPAALPYTIVRPGWFDYNAPDEHRLVLLQGDTRQSGGPSDGAVARRQIAEILVRSLGSVHALRKTFELMAAKGAAQSDFDPLFAHSMRTRRVRSTACATRRTSRWRRSRSGCATTLKRGTRPANRHLKPIAPERNSL